MKNNISAVTVISDHAFLRLRQRNGWNRKASTRMAERIYREGVRPEAVKGVLRKWIEKKSAQDAQSEYVIYGQSLYIFRGSTLITVFPVPTRKRLIDINEGKRKVLAALREDVI